MRQRTLLRIGIVGTVVTALCCFTPILVISLAALGLGAGVAYADLVLLPMLAGFILLTLVALIARVRRHG